MYFPILDCLNSLEMLSDGLIIVVKLVNVMNGGRVLCFFGYGNLMNVWARYKND